MLLKEVIGVPCGLRHMVSELRLCAGVSGRVLLGTEMLTSANGIEREYDAVREFGRLLLCGGKISEAGQNVALKLSGLKDLRGTLGRLASGAVLDDVDFFETKRLAMICCELKTLLETYGISCVVVPDTGPVVEMLDPEGLRLPSFFVYDVYDGELGELRRRMALNTPDCEELTAKALAVEDRVRRMLSERLREWSDILLEAFHAAVRTDILLAKAVQAAELGLVFPQVSEEGETTYEGMFNPEVRAALAAGGREFQRVDIRVGTEPVSIVGANMGGKTVVLKTLALCQILCQFGFGVPAAAARVAVVDRVCFTSGDSRPEQAGLSSFAAEVADIGGIISRVRRGERVLALIDEPARTTNPEEGRALVEGLIDTLAVSEARLVITTHYNLRPRTSRRLKVKGFTDSGMDYSLEEAAAGRVPHEAVVVAERLGADGEWLRNARRYLNETQTNDNNEEQ